MELAANLGSGPVMRPPSPVSVCAAGLTVYAHGLFQASRHAVSRCLQDGPAAGPRKGVANLALPIYIRRLRRYREEALIDLPTRPRSLGWLDMGCLGPCLLLASERSVAIFARLRSGRWAELAGHQLRAEGAVGWTSVLDAGCVVAADGRQLVSLSDLCRRGRRSPIVVISGWHASI